MHDGTPGPEVATAEETFDELRREFLEDAAEEIDRLLSHLNEAAAGNRPVPEALADARRAAVMLGGGANSFELELVGVAARRFDDYVASLSKPGANSLRDLGNYAEILRELLTDSDDKDETAAELLRRLPAKRGSFEETDLSPVEIEVLLAMTPGVLTRIIERELQECGYRVTTVGSCFKALEFATRTLPDLVIVSAVMPDLEGIDLCLALKAMPTTRNVGIALITSLDKDHPKLQALPPTVPIIQKNAEFGDTLTQALQDQFLL